MSIEKSAKMAGQWWAKRLMKGDKQKFAIEVESRVAAKLHELERAHPGKEIALYLESDYDPRDILLEAVQAIGIKCSGFMFSSRGILPEKTSLRVTPTTLSPKEGYGNWTADIDTTNEGTG